MSNKLYAAATICGVISMAALAHFSIDLLASFVFYNLYKVLAECGNLAEKEEIAEKQTKPKD